jgi:hypothetical protein
MTNKQKYNGFRVIFGASIILESRYKKLIADEPNLLPK